MDIENGCNKVNTIIPEKLSNSSSWEAISDVFDGQGVICKQLLRPNSS